MRLLGAAAAVEFHAQIVVRDEVIAGDRQRVREQRHAVLPHRDLAPGDATRAGSHNQRRATRSRAHSHATAISSPIIGRYM